MPAALVDALALGTALTTGVVAAVTFTLWARPEYALGLLARLTGRRQDMMAGRLTVADEAGLVALGRRLRWPALGLLFAWAFMAGAVMSWART